MYEKVTAVSGVQAITALLGEFEVEQGPDGLTMLDPAPATVGNGVRIPQRLKQWLVDLRLLRHLPIAYLVPDPALLPPESIRFFYVDPTWTDRVIDGVFSAANTGTVDAVYSYPLLKWVREAVDQELTDLASADPDAEDWRPAHGLTGMLIRSELVRRWPDLRVRAYPASAGDAFLPILRQETLSKDLFIALFGGVPKRVTIAEPFSGLRFGVEPVNATVSREPYKVDRRDANGAQNPPGITVPITLRAGPHRVIDVNQLATAIGPGAASPGIVALHLEQRPYRQLFTLSQPEKRGSVMPGDAYVELRGGRRLDLTWFNARAAEIAALEQP